MSYPRNRSKKRGYQLTADAVAFLADNCSVPFQLTPKGIDFVKDCKAELGAIAESENLPMPPRHKIDAIIAEIHAPKPAPTTCWDCGCTSIEIKQLGDYPPAYICALCDLWLGDVNPKIDLSWALRGKYQSLLEKLPKTSLYDDKEFLDTVELIQLVRAEILRIESE